MSEHNYLGMAFKAELEKNPKLMDLSNINTQLAETLKDVQRVDAANKKFREEKTGENTPRAELNRLRKALYDLEQNCRCFETRTNEAANTVKHWEHNIEGLLRRKKTAVAANMLGEERSCERQIELAESELLDAKDNLKRQQRLNHNAVTALKVWKQANESRIEELKKIVG